MTETEPKEELLSRKALAARWGVCAETIKNREKAGVLKPLKMGRKMIRYRLSEVQQIEAAA